MKPYKIGVIGTGSRSLAYIRYYVPHEKMEISALADPNKANRNTLKHLAGIKNEIDEYDNWEDMYRNRPDLDAVVICSPNHVHADQAVAYLERGLPIVLEKPIAIGKSDCERILDAERLNAGRSVVGFVLRSTPFYAKIHELVQKGEIGFVYAIQASELIGWGVTSVINRNQYKRYRKYYGSFLLSKCCHDLDIFNWITGSRPAGVHSYGRRNQFSCNPSLPETCDGCRLEDTCRYYKEVDTAAEENQADRLGVKFMRDNNRCIYNIDKDINDTNTVGLEYENGASLQFLCAMNCGGPKSGRSFHAMGTKGRIWGNIAEKRVYKYDNASEEVSEYDTAGDGSGHGGGDRSLAMELLTMIEDPDYRPIHSAYAGYLSALACFAADISNREQRRVHISYGENGYAFFD